MLSSIILLLREGSKTTFAFLRKRQVFAYNMGDSMKEFESEIDFSLSLKRAWICQDDDGRYYTLEFHPNAIALIWRNDAWEEIDFDEVPEATEILDMDVAFGLFRHSPPHELLESIEARIRRKEFEEFKNRSKALPRKVIGWAYDPEDKLARGEESQEYTDAVLLDLLEHHYNFSGDDYMTLDLRPVFDNYEYVSFSWRDFSNLMAIAHDQTGHADYVDYAFSDDDGDDMIAPEKGLYPNLKANENPLVVSETDFDFIEKARKTPSDSRVIYLLSVLKPPEEQYYFLEQSVRVISATTKREASYPIASIEIGPAPNQKRIAFVGQCVYLFGEDFQPDEDHLAIGLLLQQGPSDFNE